MLLLVLMGFVVPASADEIHGMVWNDSNNNDVKELDELGVGNVTICILENGNCTTTIANGNYSFTGLLLGTYTIYEILPIGYVQTYPLGLICPNCTLSSGFHIVTLTIFEPTISGIDFGIRMLTPPPSDVSIVQQSGDENGVPTVYRPDLTILTIQKDLSTYDVVAVNLTMTWDDGTIRNASMTEIDTTGIWVVNLSEPFPPGTARMVFEADVFPAGLSSEDFIQKGDIIFIDPSGQIRDYCTNAPINDALVWLFVWDGKTSDFIISPPENQIPQNNPLITGSDGLYRWDVISGRYFVMAEKPGYISVESQVVDIPPAVTDLDLLLTPIGGCLVNPLTLLFSQIQIYPYGAEKVLIQGEIINMFILETDSYGFDPEAYGVYLRLFQGDNQFYPSDSMMPVWLEENPAGWSITQSEKDRTGIQVLEILRTNDPNKFILKFVDTKTGLPFLDYSNIEVELSSGNYAGSMSVALIENNGKYTNN